MTGKCTSTSWTVILFLIMDSCHLHYLMSLLCGTCFTTKNVWKKVQGWRRKPTSVVGWIRKCQKQILVESFIFKHSDAPVKRFMTSHDSHDTVSSLFWEFIVWRKALFFLTDKFHMVKAYTTTPHTCYQCVGIFYTLSIIIHRVRYLRIADVILIIVSQFHRVTWFLFLYKNTPRLFKDDSTRCIRCGSFFSLFWAII